MASYADPYNQRKAAIKGVEMEDLIGWGTLALINAGLAQGKGRSGFGLFFGSLFIGPIATFLIVVLDPM